MGGRGMEGPCDDVWTIEPVLEYPTGSSADDGAGGGVSLIGASGTWKQSEDLPSPRCSQAAAMVEGLESRILMFGGIDGQALLVDLLVSSAEAESPWTERDLEPCPPPRFGHAAVAVASGMLVFGGGSLSTLSTGWTVHGACCASSVRSS